MQIFLSIDPFLDKPKPSAMPDWDARRRFGVFFVGVSGLLWPVLTVCVQDEAICVADARLRKGVYTPKGVRGVYTYTGSHSKTIVFGLITLDGEGFFQRYGSFTGKEFVEFLKAACERFGEVLMITDGAPQHRSKFVREEIGRLDGVELQFLPPGCPDLNAIEEVWRQMKHAVLDVPYVRFSSMCSDIDKWLGPSLPKLDIENVPLQKSIGRRQQARRGSCARRSGNGKRPPHDPSRI